MKTINVRELRALIPGLKEELAAQHELLLVSNGEPVARILPIQQKQAFRSLAAHRAKMTALTTSTADLIREDRDRRGT
jgi:antitoxin (DNA-binding transcriptional repressor) of toxin-antitoxin stability system